MRVRVRADPARDRECRCGLGHDAVDGEAALRGGGRAGQDEGERAQHSIRQQLLYVAVRTRILIG